MKVDQMPKKTKNHKSGMRFLPLVVVVIYICRVHLSVYLSFCLPVCLSIIYHPSIHLSIICRFLLCWCFSLQPRTVWCPYVSRLALNSVASLLNFVCKTSQCLLKLFKLRFCGCLNSGVAGLDWNVSRVREHLLLGFSYFPRSLSSAGPYTGINVIERKINN